MKKIICISGKAQHGKDTTATILSAALEDRGNKVLTFHYADLLKYLCRQYFNWNGEKDEAGRTLLQHVGTDVVRAKEHIYFLSSNLLHIVVVKTFPFEDKEIENSS